jgi:GGDEF domain-containing protein
MTANESTSATSELALYRAIVASLLDGIAVVRASDATIVWANDRLERILGRAGDALVGMRAAELIGEWEGNSHPPGGAAFTTLHEVGSWEGILSVGTSGGGMSPMRATISTFEHPEHGTVWLVMVASDGVEVAGAVAVAVESVPRRQGTVLPKRGTFQDDLTRELSRARRVGTPVSVALLSLDGELDFAEPETIDLLADATVAWRGALRDSDSIAYYDFGDFDYVALLPDCPAAEAELVTERARQATEGPRTCSAGYATWTTAEDGLSLVVRAHRALQDAKRAGGDRSVRAAGDVAEPA